MSAEKEYYVDFGSWSITAKDEKEAEEKAKQKLAKGEIPEICNIEEE